MSTATARKIDLDFFLQKASAKSLLKYICQKNTWNKSTLQSIKWEEHVTTTTGTPCLAYTHMVKLLHCVLPTHAQAKKVDGGTRQFILCGLLTKDYFHIIQCKHTTQTAWRYQFLRELLDFFIQSDISPLLRGFMMDGVRSWFSSTTGIKLLPEHYHSMLRNIIDQQNNIDWV